MDSLLENLSNKEIAAKLNMSERTAKFHVSNLLAKYGVRRRADLILLTYTQLDRLGRRSAAVELERELRGARRTMELISVRRELVEAGRVRVTGAVRYDDRPGTTEEYWFEVPAGIADSLSDSGNPWLVALLPMAAALGEPLRVPLPVDRLLLRNLREVMVIWRVGSPRLRVVPLEALVSFAASGRGEAKDGHVLLGRRRLVLHTAPQRGGRGRGFPVDELIAIHGFDILLEDDGAFERHRRRLERVAAATGKTLLPVRMNLRQTRLRELSMSDLWHGCALASVGLLLENRYDRILIARARSTRRSSPWGSHPLTDPLLSTSGTAFLHDGAALARWEKLEFLTRFDLAMGSLRVCTRSTSEENCGACEKCCRNMIILEVLGALARSSTFPAPKVDLDESRACSSAGWRSRSIATCGDWRSRGGARRREGDRSELPAVAMAAAGF